MLYARSFSYYQYGYSPRAVHEKSGTGTDFSPDVSVSLCQYYSINAQYSLINEFITNT
jgi:hypothetical protein